MREDIVYERQHLDAVLGVQKREAANARQRADEMRERVRRLELAEGSSYSNELVIAGEMNARLQIRARALEAAGKAPYFARVDFAPDRDEPGRWYIGKHGIPDGDDIAVVDWRSPLANLYYGGNLGRTDYEAPDGVIHGEMTLKRNFSIENGRLVDMLDADIAGADALLIQTLSQMTSDRLREVVSTLQGEQNRIIRYPLTEPLVVQGVAGSGKTTIMLHRIAYLLYTYPERLGPENLLVLAPSPLFLGYISSVLPDLGVENVLQSTWAGLCLRLMGKRAPKLNAEKRPDDLPPEEAERWREGCALKGSPEMARWIDRFLDAFEPTLLPDRGFALGPAPLLGQRQMREMFGKDLLPFPVERRLKELLKMVKARLHEAAASVPQALRDATTQRADLLVANQPDSPSRRERIERLYRSADERVSEVQQAAEDLKKELPGLFSMPTLMQCYAAFLESDPAGFGCEGEAAEAFARMAQSALPNIRKKRADIEDMGPLLWMARRLYGFEDRPKTVHVVIDEAQDMPPLSLLCLQHIFHASYTLVGDMAQGVYRYRGLQSWQQAMDALGSRAHMLYLNMSYRSTAEIIAFANGVARRMGQREAVSVGRHGVPVEIQRAASPEEHEAALRRLIHEAQSAGMRSIALLTRTAKQADRVALRFGAVRIDPEKAELGAGVFAGCAAEVKGLEFDAVLLPDLEAYGDDPDALRLLYVACTRPLHRLMCLYGPENA